MLSIENLTYTIGGRTLLDNVSLRINPGQKVALIGKNGMGKSTLFGLIAGQISADAGKVFLSDKITLGIVRQDLPDDDTTLIDVVLSSHTQMNELYKEAETATDPDRIGYIYQRLEEIGAYDAESRAATILAGLGFDDKAQQMPIASFSGGWRMRVALAAVLFLRPDLLLLDEPTNHLDFEAMIWLESYLMRLNATLFVISHDRDFLNKIVDHVIHLEDKKLTLYTGNYDQFERNRALRLMNQQALHEKQTQQKERMMKFVERFRATASKARQAQSRLKMIEKMDVVDAVIESKAVPFIFGEVKDIGSPFITMTGVNAGYEDKTILKHLNLRIDSDDRIALLGANGNGKSTLMKLISGRLDVQKGDLHIHNKLSIGYFAQHQTEELDVSKTAYELMADVIDDKSETKVRAVLGKFGFDKAKSDTIVKDLSGGEKSRLLLALMSCNNPHILLLDEPTNHLDIEAREALMQALNNYNGAVVIVSHDNHLIDRVADRLWLVENGTCRPFDGDTSDYRKLVLQNASGKKNQKMDSDDKDDEKKKYKNNSKLERKIVKLQEEIANLQSLMVNEKRYQVLEDLNQQYNVAKNKLEQLEQEWVGKD